jgi:hypothetical protein
MKFPGLGKKFLLPACVAGLVALACASAFADDFGYKEVTPGEKSGAKPVNDDAPDLMREYLWEGSFDKAGDATRAAEQQLKSYDFNCEKIADAADAADNPEKKNRYIAFYNDCKQRRDRARTASGEAAGIRKEQRLMSDISKVSDMAAVTAVGAAIYGELGMKNNNQAASFEQAANIQRTAGYADYAAGATDLALGATAYLHQKQKLEQIQKQLSSQVTTTEDGKQKTFDQSESAINTALSNAAEQAKQAAYSHMLYGAGKMAAGYASVWASKRTAQQAANLESMDMSQYYPPMVPTAATPPAYAVVGNNNPPAYVSNQPTFTYPAGMAASTGAAAAGSPAGTTNFRAAAAGGAGGSGSSAAPNSAASRSLASAALGSGKGLTASGGGASSGTGASEAPASSPDDAAAEKTKEAVGPSFEMSLTGGIRNSFGGSGSGGSGSDTNSLASLLGNVAGDNKNGGTNISPAALMQEAGQSPDGAQGSGPGVSSSDSSLFEQIRSRITKRLELGDVGASKNVEVKN